MRCGSAVNNDRKRFSPVVPLPFFYLLMALNYFMELPLPASVAIPDGAVNHGAEATACLVRSQHTVPLKKQHAAFKEDEEIYEEEREAGEYPTLQAYFFSDMYNMYHYKNLPLNHPANVVGLEAAFQGPT